MSLAGSFPESRRNRTKKAKSKKVDVTKKVKDCNPVSCKKKVAFIAGNKKSIR